MGTVVPSFVLGMALFLLNDFVTDIASRPAKSL
jgi:hypothetical protein